MAAEQWKVKLGAEMPNFSCNTTHGDFLFHEFLESAADVTPWTVLFSHPKDFTPVCTTELGRCETLGGEFKARGVKLIGVSCDSVEEHLAWSADILHREGITKSKLLSFPIIADANRLIVQTLGMLDPDEVNAAGVPLPARALIIIGPDKKVKLSILYPATTGRNFDEVLRVIDSVQLTAGNGLATPVDWKQGERCIVGPGMATEDAQQRFTNLVTEALPSGKQYLRSVDCPKK
jgi:1-Cys peroxiredoxin 6